MTLAAVAGAGAWLLLRTPDYHATARVLVTPLPFDDSTYSGLPILKDAPGDPVRAVQSAAAMIDSPAAAARAAQSLGGDWTAARVRAALTIVPIGGSNVVAVEASDRHPQTAAALARAYATAALEQRRQTLAVQAQRVVAQLRTGPTVDPLRLDSLVAVMQGYDPTLVLLSTSTPALAAGPSTWRVLASALFAGLVLGILLTLLTDSLRRRRRPAEAKTEAAVHPLPARQERPLA